MLLLLHAAAAAMLRMLLRAVWRAFSRPFRDSSALREATCCCMLLLL